MENKQWRAVPREEPECSGQRVIEDENGDEVAYVGFDEDAELIVVAVNAHAALAKAIKTAHTALFLADRDEGIKAARKALGEAVAALEG